MEIKNKNPPCEYPNPRWKKTNQQWIDDNAKWQRIKKHINKGRESKEKNIVDMKKKSNNYNSEGEWQWNQHISMMHSRQQKNPQSL